MNRGRTPAEDQNQRPRSRIKTNAQTKRQCLGDSNGVFSFEKLYATLRHWAGTRPPYPPYEPCGALRAASRMSGHARQHLQQVLEGVP